MTNITYIAPCVRACALRNLFLATHEWQQVTAIANTEGIIDWLKKRGITTPQADSVSGIIRSAHELVAQRASAFLRFTRTESADLLKYFILYYDLLNIETAAYRIHNAIPEEDYQVDQFYTTGNFGMITPRILNNVTSFTALGRVVSRSIFEEPYTTASRRYQEDGDIVQFVENLDFVFFKKWIDTAEACGFSIRTGSGHSALRVFFTTRVIEIAVRLQRYRDAQSGELRNWLSLVTLSGNTENALRILSQQEDEHSQITGLVQLLLPWIKEDDVKCRDLAPPGCWNMLNMITMEAALKATRGIVFNADFLCAFLIRQIYQARHLTMLLQAREAGIPIPDSGYGGNES